MTRALLNVALNITGKAVAAFGFVSVATTLLVALLLRESLLSDNPYIMGWAVAILITPAAALLLAVEHLWGLRVATFTYAAYCLLLSAYCLYVFYFGELHAPGIAVMLLVGVAVYAPTLYVVVRSNSLHRWIRAGWLMAGIFLIGLSATYLAAYLAFQGA